MEDRIVADWFSKPGDSIRAVMQRKCIGIEEVAQRLDGGIDTLRSLLDGSRAIDRNLANRLTVILGASPAFWLSRQENFEKAVDRAVAAMAKGDIDDFIRRVPAPGSRPKGKLSVARQAEEVRKRLVYFSVPNPKSWQEHYGRLVGRIDFRTSIAFEAKEEATLLWLRRGELEADLVKTKPWNSDDLIDRLQAIKELSRLKLPGQFLPKLRSLLAEAGVALAVVKAPNGCRASGATRLLDPHKAMILVSFRHRSDDQFWFTLFHEIGHLVLHHAQTFVDVDEMQIDHREDEANIYARRCIVPDEYMEEFEALPEDRERITRFSVRLKMAPGLTVGQMQKRRKIGPDRLNYLKRRWTWEQIAPIEA